MRGTAANLVNVFLLLSGTCFLFRRCLRRSSARYSQVSEKSEPFLHIFIISRGPVLLCTETEWYTVLPYRGVPC